MILIREIRGFSSYMNDPRLHISRYLLNINLIALFKKYYLRKIVELSIHAIYSDEEINQHFSSYFINSQQFSSFTNSL